MVLIGPQHVDLALTVGIYGLRSRAVNTGSVCGAPVNTGRLVTALCRIENTDDETHLA